MAASYVIDFTLGWSFGEPQPSDVDTGAWFLDCVEDAYKPNPQ